MTETYIPGAPCPCGCGETGSKLSFKTGHVARSCKCAPCRGRRNQAKGKRGQAKTHKRLGGTSWTPTHEESGRPYTIEVSVLPEVKTGQQIPVSWSKFVSTEWFRRAYEQSERAVPFGTGVVPAVVLEGRWLIADLKPKKGEQVA